MMPQSTFPTPPATTTAARPQVIVDVEDEDVDRSVGVNGAEAIEPRGRSEGMITMTKTATTTPCRRKSANSKPPYLTVLPRLSVRRQKERREKTSSVCYAMLCYVVRIVGVVVLVVRPNLVQ